MGVAFDCCGEHQFLFVQCRYQLVASILFRVFGGSYTFNCFE
jgi:hypothetical protein